MSAVANFKNMDEDELDFQKKYGHHYEWGFAMREFYRKDEFVSVRSSTYHWSGGAHPNHWISSQNFFGEGLWLLHNTGNPRAR